ncbi:hypothetical protein MPER_13229 [Moniliophthora perniciosa FA553]|nr:hypothetical protein MPER_13229 [Moniliophthora perniciosa FA553]
MGIPKKEHEERSHLFSLSKPYMELKYARTGLTSFSAQMVREHLLQTTNRAVSEEGGLHTFTTGARPISEEEYGADTLEATISQPPITRNRCSRAQDASEGARAVQRNDRPPEIVSAYAISSILYSRHRYAKLLPADNGLLLFSCGANRYLFSHHSRNGSSTSYHATYHALEKYAEHDKQLVLELGTSPDRSAAIRFDNIQKHNKPRDYRIGRSAHMLIGTAGTAFEIHGFERGMLDLSEKQEWSAKNLRSGFTFEKLWNEIDHSYFTRVLPLLWLETLLDFTPELEIYRPKLRDLWNNKDVGTKHKVAPRQTRILPLPTNGYNETVTAELNKSIRDFLACLGQTAESYNMRSILFGGDGLTYERMVQLKNYLQFMDNEYERLDIVEPFLEIWHTVWTNLSRVYEAHWVGLTSADPSTLGFSANAIKRKAPGNVSKVDYYPYVDLLDTVLDGKVLDIWRNQFGAADLFGHFTSLSERGTLPTFEDLYAKAKSLHQTYGSTAAYIRLMNGSTSGYQRAVKEWIPPKQDKSSEVLGSSKKQKAASAMAAQPSQIDGSLARSTRLINDALMSRLIINAVSRGDVGGVWECFKMMAITFAGSTHTKYTAYTLEMICNFLYEVGPNIQKIFFENWLVSPSGHGFMAGDLLQEQLQDELYEHVNSKDTGFDEDYLRKVIAPNVYRFQRVKKDIHASLGLARRSGHHITPSKLADVRKLMSRYQLEEAHLLQPGRQYKEAALDRVDDYGRGIRSLQDGRLKRWVDDTCWVRGLNQASRQTEDLQIHTFDESPEGIIRDEQLRQDGFCFGDDGPLNEVLEDTIEPVDDDEQPTLYAGDQDVSDEDNITILGPNEQHDWDVV